MTVFVALLRAVNVGGTGILAMKRLHALFAAYGLDKVRTYIQSGNVVFKSGHAEGDLKTGLEQVLADATGRRLLMQIHSAMSRPHASASSFCPTLRQRTFWQD